MGQKAFSSTIIFLAVLIPSVVVLGYANSSLIPNVKTVNYTDSSYSVCTATVGQRVENFLIQKINSDHVDGLLYILYPVGSDVGSPRTFHIGDSIGYACDETLAKLTDIDYSAQIVTFTKIVSNPTYGCPICLSGNTLIGTPEGRINIKDLKVGMPIFTQDKFGHHQTAIILKVSRTEVPSSHMMVDVVLEDGRELFASPGHPLDDGRKIGNIKSGDLVDNSVVKSVKLISYDQKNTYDVLPSGDTGFYLANGILVGSTLKSQTIVSGPIKN